MTTPNFQERKSRPREKCAFYPFSEMDMTILDELLKEARQEIFQEKSNKKEENT